jgi:hypothetical protein
MEDGVRHRGIDRFRPARRGVSPLVGNRPGSGRMCCSRPGISIVLGLLLVMSGRVLADTESARLYTPLGVALGRPTLRFTVADTIEIVAHRNGPPRPLAMSALGAIPSTPTMQERRQRAFSFMTHVRTFERPRFSRAIVGAGQLAGTASALSGLGLVGGLWGDKTAGYLMGAGAVLGALWGATLGADAPGIRLGVDPGPAGPEPGWRAPGTSDHDRRQTPR